MTYDGDKLPTELIALPSALMPDDVFVVQRGVEVYKVEAENLVAGEYSILFVVQAGFGAIQPGIKGDIFIPLPGTIAEWKIVADQIGSIAIDILKSDYDNYPPVDSIAGTPITISNDLKAVSADLSDWDQNVLADDILRFKVDSCTNISKVTIQLKIART